MLSQPKTAVVSNLSWSFTVVVNLPIRSLRKTKSVATIYVVVVSCRLVMKSPAQLGKVLWVWESPAQFGKSPVGLGKPGAVRKKSSQVRSHL